MKPFPSRYCPGMGHEELLGAYRRAQSRAEASARVAGERLAAVVTRLLADGCSVREVAALTGVGKSTVARLAHAGGDPVEVDPEQYRAALEASVAICGDVASAENRQLLRARRLDAPQSCAVAEQLAREVLAVVHPGLEVSTGVLMVASVQVARDPDTAYAIAGYDGDVNLAAKISSARGRAAYCRADWVDDADPLF